MLRDLVRRVKRLFKSMDPSLFPPFHLTVHRGTKQIGGSITEISTASTRVFIDMGTNLPGEGEKMTPRQERAFVRNMFNHNQRKVEAVVYTHGHDDHIGMMRYVPSDVPQYMSKPTIEILKIKYEAVKLAAEAGEDIEGQENADMMLDLLDRVIPFYNEFNIGDIKFTAFDVSHGIYDSKGFYIETPTKKILHTGDYRYSFPSTGNIIAAAEKYQGQVDILITEGTNLNSDGQMLMEKDLVPRFEGMMNAFKYVFILTSATDIERLGVILKSAFKAKRKIAVCSKLIKAMMEFYKKAKWNYNEKATPSVEGYTDYVFSSKFYHTSYAYLERFIKMLAGSGFVMPVGLSNLPAINHIREHLNPAETLLIYSMWPGYYTIPEQVAINPAFKRFRDSFENVVDIVTSGHADRKTIQTVIEQVNPKEYIIAIHKDESASLKTLNLNEDLKSKVVENSLLYSELTLN